jgi:cytoskeletal protein RodZ
MSFGEELKRERKLREITLREVSESTKISLRYLEALERNDFDNLPGGVFNRGFVRAYSEFIGVDPESMVNSYVLEERAAGISPPDTEETNSGGRNPKTASRILVVVIVILALGIGAFMTWHYLIRDKVAAPAASQQDSQETTP